jgi:hypothetical protein
MNAREPASEWPAIDSRSQVPGGIEVKIQLSSGEERTDFPRYANLFTALFGPSGAVAMFRKSSAAVQSFLGSNRCKMFIVDLPADDRILAIDGNTAALLSRRTIGQTAFSLPPASVVRKAMAEAGVPKMSMESLRSLAKRS